MTHPPAQRPRATARRGLTFIEVIIATITLTGLAGVVLGAISFMEASAERQRHRLQAMEVAHRIVAQYLDNPDLLPAEHLPIQQGRSYYRYTLREEVLEMQGAAGDELRRGRGRVSSELTIEERLPAMMLTRITVQVFLDDPHHPVVDATRPAAVLVRMFNPFSSRDEDATLKELLRLVEEFEREQADRARRESQRLQRRDGGR